MPILLKQFYFFLRSVFFTRFLIVVRFFTIQQLKMRTFILLSLIHYTSAAEAATVDTGVGECLLRTGRGMATPLTVNIVDGDKVPYSSRSKF